MEENVDTQDLTAAREKALAAHQHAVEEHTTAVAAADEKELGLHRDAVDEEKQDKVDWFAANPPTKYEDPAKPVEDVTDRSKDAKPIPLMDPNDLPKRHEHSEHDAEGRDLTLEDADFEADETNRKDGTA